MVSCQLAAIVIITTGASGVGLLAMLVLGVRWKLHGGWKSKKKRDAES